MPPAIQLVEDKSQGALPRRVRVVHLITPPDKLDTGSTTRAPVREIPAVDGEERLPEGRRRGGGRTSRICARQETAIPPEASSYSPCQPHLVPFSSRDACEPAAGSEMMLSPWFGRVAQGFSGPRAWSPRWGIGLSVP